MESHRSYGTASVVGVKPGEVDGEAFFLPSFAQERLWFMDQLDPDSFAYHLRLPLQLKGFLNIAALHQSLQAIVDRHEALRTTFVPVEGRPMQAIAPYLAVALPLMDLTQLEEQERETQMHRLITEAVEQHFDLQLGPLMRAQLLRLAPGDHVLIVTLHHIVADGWATEIFVQELNTLYNAYATGQEPTLPELPIQYADYAVWQRQLLQGDVLAKQLDYWRQHLAGAPPLLELPTDHPRPAVQTHKGNRYIFEFSLPLIEALRALSAREGVTLFMTLLAAFQTLLMRYTGQEDLVVGTPVAGRTRLEVKHLIGLFANTLVLRTDLSGNPTFRQLLKHVREVCLNAYEYQELPFEKLVEELQPQRSLSYSPLFQVLFGHANFASGSPEFSNLTLVPLEVERATARFDLACDFLEDAQELSCRLEYNTDLFEPATIARLATHLQTLLASIVAHPDQYISELALLGPAEQEQLLLTWNSTAQPMPQAQSLLDIFEAQASQTPESIALACEDQQLTYAELNQCAERLAQQLQQLGVEHEYLVGICLERSVEMVVALLGTLKAGGAYVPLDPAYPAERLAFIAQNAQLTVLLTQQPLLAQLPSISCPVLCLDTDEAMLIPQQDRITLRTANHPLNLAYVLYTSGSTGQPKGVQISHAALLNFLSSMQQQFHLSWQDVLMAVTSLSFDIAGLELYLPLLTGARLEIATRQTAQDGILLADHLSRFGATALQATPATWRMLLAVGWQSHLRLRVLCGGEALPGALAGELQAGGADVWNLYGPTETTIWSSIYPVPRKELGEGAMPLGAPIANTQFYVLDPAGHLAPLGVPGELCIGGVGLARGYLGRPDLTAEHFVPHPFSSEPGARLYRTGDRVRYLVDGTLEYLGRIDFQVKLRGYRIELGEIETLLNQQPGVAQAVVVLREVASGDQRLVAYVVPEAGQEKPTSSTLRQALQAHLPEYMLPAAYVMIERWPLTPNGKIDRRALPPPEWTAQQEEGYIAPRTPTEETLADIWTEILQLERVGIHDNFFALGGHSLLGVQLMQRISDAFRITLPMRTLFEAPTISELALTVEQGREKQGKDNGAALTLPKILSDTKHRLQPFPLTDVQQAYWIGRNAAFELGNVATHSYTEWESWNLDLDRYTRAWRRLISRHEMLRAIVQPDGQQRILAEVPPLEIAVQDLRGQAPEVVAARLDAVREEMSHQVLPTDRWPLFEIRASLLDGGRIRMHRSADMLMVDAWSWQILTRELTQFYLDPDRELPPLTLSFRDYVLTEYALRKKELYRRARDYWWNRLPDLPPAPELPLAQNPATLTQPHFTRRTHQLEPELWGKIKQAASRGGLTPSGILLAAFAEVLGMWSKNPRFTINLTLFNRLPLHPQVNDIIGDFTSLTLLAVDHSARDTFAKRAKRLQQQLWEDLEHRHVSGIAVLRELARIHGNTARARMPVVFTSALNLQGPANDAAQEQEPAWQAEHVYGITQTSQAWLDHQVREDEGTLVYSWDAVEDLFPAGLLDDLFSAYHQLLTQLAAEEQWEAITATSPLPPAQLEQRAFMNATEAPLSTELLHSLFTSQVGQRPQQSAVVTPGHTLSYQEADARARQIGHLLRAQGVRPNQLVGVVMEKGWEQVVGVLGVLYAGGAYLPIDPDLPSERLRYLLKHGEVQIALTQSWLDQQIAWPTDIQHLSVDQLEPGDLAQAISVPLEPVQQPEDLAYVIFTSGSTGLPKGVMIDHRGAVNTVLDINERFGVGPKDRVLALSALNFDLSVYDIFGILGAGGTIVLPTAGARRDPAHWIELLEQERVTIWNSVPALMDLAVTHLSSTRERPPEHLRLVMMSGDWIPVNLPDQIRALWKNTQVISLGGATEASIWSILFPIEHIEPGWKSIPYGHPMRNQRFHVLNARLEPSPTWVPGELYIGGIGLAQGYWRDEAKTAASFFIHPKTGERLYRTGDLGRYLPTGEIEFLGREDFQIKIRGYRIELGEIEAVLTQQSGVGQVVVVVREDIPGDKRLVAYVVPAPGAIPPSPEALRQAAQEHLPDYMVPAAILLIETLPLTANGKVDRRVLPAPDWTAAQDREAAVAPRTPAEQKVADLWKQVLGIEQVSIHDNFFELGGHSVLAVQLLARIFETFQVNIPLRTLFEEPTIAELSKHLAEEPAVVHPPVKSALPEPGDTHPRSFGQLNSPEERARFKESQHGLHKDRPGSRSVHLVGSEVDEAMRRLYAERRSARKFGSERVSFEQFSGLLNCLRQISLDGKPKYRWGSAGGLYPVQVYLHIKPVRVEGLAAGTYYYHPVDHRLAAIAPNAHIGPEIHAWINQLLYEQAAFSIFLIGQLNAIEPLYGDSSRDFCLIEAGLITQLLETSAPAQHIGLCQVGNVNFHQVQHLFDLENGYVYLHGLLGGTRAADDDLRASQPTNAEEEWEEGQI